MIFRKQQTAGIGYSIAKWTAVMGATVIIACRSEAKAREAILQMNEEFRAEKDKGTQGLLSEDQLRLEFMPLDLASLKSVMEFVEQFKRSGRQLHVLFCNAGIALGPYVKTEDGFEMVFQVNYLSHFLLVCKLLPTMRSSGPDCRILLMSSVVHKLCSFDLQTINYEGPPGSYGPMEYYGRSKLYQIMQMYSMHERLQDTNITVNSFHPGAVSTNIGRDAYNCLDKCIVCYARNFGNSPENAARCSINCATNPDMSKTSGVYFDNFIRKPPSSTARDQHSQERLWKLSFTFLKDYITDQEKEFMEGNNRQ